MNYRDFLARKIAAAKSTGEPVEASAVHPRLKPHQRDIVRWAVLGGCRAIFAAFGLGKTGIQLEIVRIILERVGGMGLIVIPLGVRLEFMREAEQLGLQVRFIRTNAEIDGPGIYLTNYESVRDGKLDPRLFVVASLDEASVLRGFGGTKTFREFMALFAGDRKTLNARTRAAAVKYRFVATATPSPNDYIELLAYAAFLGIMDVSAAKTRFFKRDSTKADHLTIHPHKEAEFWLWVASWAIFVQRPSDLGHPDEGYELPPLDVRWHEVATDHSTAGAERDGQSRLFKNVAVGVQDAAKEKRESLPARMSQMMEIIAEAPREKFLLWHDLEAERSAIEAIVPGVVSVYGSQDLDEREQHVADFSDGKIKYLAAKPVLCGSGCNFQRYCARAVFLGIGFKFNDFIQAVHRIQRFLQTRGVRIDLIYTEAEREVRRTLERKWKQHIEQVERMSALIRKYGLSTSAMQESLTRAMGVQRTEVTGDGYTLVNNDCIVETERMAENSVGLILTSVPFSTQYEYSPNYADFGHTDNNEHFFQQMDFLTPQLLRVLQPGRIAAIHVKDRIVPGGMTGLGFQVVYPFHAKCIEHYTRHGFAYMGMKTIVTDVVRENNQTYRLGWTEQCKDGTKMGVGMPEYLLLFRKPPTGNENSYADLPVVKQKTDYTRARWQVDAHGFARSSGNRLMRPEELAALPHNVIFKLFREHSRENVYDFEKHVELGEALEAKKILPVTFMLLQPQSWTDEVWSDITRMLTLNGAQSAAGREMHLCPMQFDMADRVIEQMSMEGEVVFDPFVGLGTVVVRALKKKRKGVGVELSARYFADAATYCEATAREMSMPSLFDAIELLDAGGSDRSGAPRHAPGASAPEGSKARRSASHDRDDEPASLSGADHA
jgi:DNA modification methylase